MDGWTDGRTDGWASGFYAKAKVLSLIFFLRSIPGPSQELEGLRTLSWEQVVVFSPPADHLRVAGRNLGVFTGVSSRICSAVYRVQSCPDRFDYRRRKGIESIMTKYERGETHRQFIHVYFFTEHQLRIGNTYPVGWLGLLSWTSKRTWLGFINHIGNFKPWRESSLRKDGPPKQHTMSK